MKTFVPALLLLGIGPAMSLSVDMQEEWRVAMAPREVVDPITALYRAGLYDRVVSAGRTALKKYPSDPNISKAVAYSLMFNGEWRAVGDVVLPSFRTFEFSDRAVLLGLSKAMGAQIDIDAPDLVQIGNVKSSTIGQEYQSIHGESGADKLLWLLVLVEKSGGKERELFLEKALEVAPKDTFVNGILAKDYRAARKLDESLKCYRTAIATASKERKKRLEAERKEVEKLKELASHG